MEPPPPSSSPSLLPPNHQPDKSSQAQQSRLHPALLFERTSIANAPTSAEAQHATSGLRRAHTVAQGRNMGERINLGAKSARERMATSFLRVKDSHELLRKRSLRRLDVTTPSRDALAGAREPNHFTVGNVGQNGKIFLRPVRNPSLQESRPPPFAASTSQSREEYLHPLGRGGHVANEPSRWSNSQLSELRPELIPEETCEDAASVKSVSSRSGHPLPHSRPLQRAHSFSTISEQQSVSRAGRHGEFRIFIDQSEARPRSAYGSLRPSLDSPLPQYRSGMSRLNVDSSTPVHGSVYSRASVSDNFRASLLLRENWDTGPMSDAYVDPGRPSFAASMFSGAAALELARNSTVTGNPVFYELKEPIEPSIFETLMSQMDDESVVRYIPGSKDISAATPARIVAQISSESFMDYELVSDFFLTFRSYLSAGNLLALLLARLQWAINRPQDDGRIIRIRTFAALRHWILNYFVDDFMSDYDLRTRFCDTINNLYDDVKARECGGTSDLKILIDLKRCWYGKCSTYWEFQDQHIAYNSPDHVIIPGGDGQLERNSADYNLNIVRTKSSQAVDGGEIERRNTAQHDRNNSSTTARSMPISAESDRSFQATSCSLPPKSPKRLSLPYTVTKAPHPVPLVPSQHTGSSQDLPRSSPIIARRFPYHTHTHKRSGSFSDSVRDGRPPPPFLKLHQQGSFSAQETLNLGALIRGELFGPAESYMTMMAPPSPPLPLSASTPVLDRRSTSDAASKPPTSSSGVKTIIGSIRRALHSRNGGPSISSRYTNAPPGSSMRGKTSALPNNVAYRSDLYREKKPTTAARRPVRIDVLCDESLRLYHRAVNGSTDLKASDASHVAAASQGEETQRGSGRYSEASHQSMPERPRVRSQLTTGSESIVIVDDTGFGNPLMSGALGDMHSGLEQPPRFLNVENSPSTLKAPSLYAPSQRSTLAGDEYSLPIFYDDTDSRSLGRNSRLLRPPSLSTERRSTSVGRGSRSWKRGSPSLRLRKYASFQSGFSRHFLGSGNDPGHPAVDQNPQEHFEKHAGPTLRRRPGGDLRQMRNEIGLRNSGSFLSDLTPRSSMAESTATRLSRPQTSLVPPNPRHSMIQARSSQNVRRSLEAAMAQFAQIPDDDDGGIESALLKLEGKWDDIGGGPATGSGELQHGAYGQYSRGRELYYHGQPRAAPSNRLGVDTGAQRHQSVIGGNLTYSQVRGRIVPRRPYSDSIAESEDSYSSIPLLERGLSDESMKKPPTSMGPSHPAATKLRLSDVSKRDTSDFESSHPSFDVVKETDSMRRIPRGSTIPTPVSKTFKNHAGRLSGLSSEISVDWIDPQEASDQHRLSVDTRSLSDSSFGIPPHPLAHPPSPPISIPNPRSVTSCATPLNPVLFQAQPPTPESSPRHRDGEQLNSRSVAMQNVSGDVLSRSELEHQNQASQKVPGPDHVPFVLSCESQVLAQQLTLVEVAALSEVDWRDLVDMKWSSGSPSMLSWVQFLMDEERRGIDLVVGRFNLMVKWILSEIILTRDIDERARTITKFIHTAAHARHMCNYATMLQIAIALSSTDCSRLQTTWSYVPAGDRRLLKDMELLIQPIRNFHDLRVEMETANAQEGCIPFVGLYVHDLTYNAQKPAQVASRDGEPLVNFERYRTTAKIVKSLLRLIDASTKYNFEPVQGIIERCLWIASLSEEDIQARSKQLD